MSSSSNVKGKRPASHSQSPGAQDSLKRQRTGSERAGNVQPAIVSPPLTMADLQKEIKARRKSKISRIDKHHWIEERFKEIERVRPQEMEQMMKALSNEHDILYKNCKLAADTHLAKFSKNNNIWPTIKSKSLAKAFYISMLPTFDWELEHTESEDRKTEIMSLLHDAEAAGLDFRTESKSNLQILEERLQKVEEARKERLPFFCDILEGKSNDWSRRVRLHGKGWDKRFVETIEKLITTKCFPGKDEKSQKEKESSLERLRRCTTHRPEHENLVIENCEKLLHSPFREEVRSELLQDDALKDAIQRIRQQYTSDSDAAPHSSVADDSGVHDDDNDDDDELNDVEVEQLFEEFTTVNDDD